MVDAYTKRIFSRKKLFPEDTDYHQVQKIFMENLKKMSNCSTNTTPCSSVWARISAKRLSQMRNMSDKIDLRASRFQNFVDKQSIFGDNVNYEIHT